MSASLKCADIFFDPDDDSRDFKINLKNEAALQAPERNLQVLLCSSPTAIADKIACLFRCWQGLYQYERRQVFSLSFARGFPPVIDLALHSPVSANLNMTYSGRGEDIAMRFTIAADFNACRQSSRVVVLG